MVTEKTEQHAQFTFHTPEEGKTRLQLETIGNLSIKGSMPDQTVFQIHREARARDRVRAGELLDRIAMVPEMDQGGLLRLSPKFPEVASGESVFVHATVLVPLNQPLPVSVAITRGNLEVAGTQGDLKVKSIGKNTLSVRAYQGYFDIEAQTGEVSLGNILHGGRIRMDKGKISISQRKKEPMDDVVVELKSGEVHLEIQHGYTGRIFLSAPEIQNNTSLVPSTSPEGKGIRVHVEKGTIHLVGELY